MSLTRLGSSKAYSFGAAKRPSLAKEINSPGPGSYGLDAAHEKEHGKANRYGEIYRKFKKGAPAIRFGSARRRGLIDLTVGPSSTDYVTE